MSPDDKEWWRQKNQADNQAATNRWHQEQMSRNNSQNTKGGGCFIATAAFGNYNSPEVVYLSEFRDKTLNQHTLGRSFIRAYYALSPPFATVIAKSDFLRLLIRKCILQPIIFFLKKVTR